jgi:hypothetical protein
MGQISCGALLLSLLFAGILLWSCQQAELLVELRSGTLEYRTFLLGKLRDTGRLSTREIHSRYVAPDAPVAQLGGIAIELKGGEVLEFDPEGFQIKEARRIAGEVVRALRVPLGCDKVIWWPRGAWCARREAC